MTVSDTVNRKTYAGDDATKEFAFAYPLRALSDLRVYIRAADGTETLKTAVTHYTIAGSANAGTGGYDDATITFLEPPDSEEDNTPATGETVVLVRDTGLTSSYDPDVATPDSAPAREGIVDRLVLALQGIQDQLRRTLRQSITSPTLDLVLPSPATDVAGDLLAINAEGNGFTLVATSTLDAGQAVTSFIQTLLDDTNAAAAQTTLGISAFVKTILDDADAAAVLTTLGVSAFVQTILDDANAAAVRTTIGAPAATALVGKHTIWLPASSWIPRTTNGCAEPTVIEATTNKNNRRVLDFDKDAIEYAQADVFMPQGWNAGTLTAQFVYETTGTGDVIFGIQAVCIRDSDLADIAFGTAVEVTDTALDSGDVMKTAETAAMTVGGTPAKGNLVQFQIYRKATDGNDTLDQDARLRGVVIFYTTDSLTDEAA